MTNANDARKAHKILDDLFKGNVVLDEEREFLRGALPELPKQKTLEEITIHVLDAWSCTSDNQWGGDGFDPDVSIEDWLWELHKQLQGLKDAPTAEPAHPEFLETEADYAAAPEGTIVARDGENPCHKLHDKWLSFSFFDAKDNRGMSLAIRQILRWGWGE